MVYRVLSSSLSYTLLQNYIKNIVSTITNLPPSCEETALRGDFFCAYAVDIFF